MASASHFPKSKTSSIETGESSRSAPPAAPTSSSTRSVVVRVLGRKQSSEDSISLLGRVSPPQEDANPVVSHVCREIKELFRPAVAEIYIKLLKETGGLDVNCNGWTLLHYAVYRMSDFAYDRRPGESGKRVLALIEYLLAAGINPRPRDLVGREPICFGSSLVVPDLNQQLWNHLIDVGMEINPQDQPVSPLHVASFLLRTNIAGFLQRGADAYSLDRFGRMPLHCAAMNGPYSSPETLEKLRLLLSHGPAAVETADAFGNYPLYYALLFGFAESATLLLEASSSHVVGEVRQRIANEPFTDETVDWRGYYQLDDPIYLNLDQEVSSIGGAPPKKKKEKAEIIADLAAVEEGKKHPVKAADGKVYYAHHDGHGYKHLAAGELALKRYEADRRKFIAATKTGNAQFFPTLYGTKPAYDALLIECVIAWVEEGAQGGEPYIVDMKVPIGADKGDETSFVQIYGMSSLGAHIRPKSPNSL